MSNYVECLMCWGMGEVNISDFKTGKFIGVERCRDCLGLGRINLYEKVKSSIEHTAEEVEGATAQRAINAQIEGK